MGLLNPKTWFGSSCKAKRVSSYRFGKIADPGNRSSWIYSLECDVRTPSGEVVRESVSFVSAISVTYNLAEYEYLLEKLREQIRKK